jgi:hypothetical protein
VRLSFSWGIGKVAMNRRSRRDETAERKWTDNHSEQHQQHHLLHRPK